MRIMRKRRIDRSVQRVACTLSRFLLNNGERHDHDAHAPLHAVSLRRVRAPFARPRFRTRIRIAKKWMPHSSRPLSAIIQLRHRRVDAAGEQQRCAPFEPIGMPPARNRTAANEGISTCDIDDKMVHIRTNIKGNRSGELATRRFGDLVEVIVNFLSPRAFRP